MTRQWNPPLEDIHDEMNRQLELWGPQGHDSAHGPATVYLSITSDEARQLVDAGVDNGELTWADVALAEFAKVLDAPTEQVKRGELVQLAAVCASWIEAIDLREQYADLD